MMVAAEGDGREALARGAATDVPAELPATFAARVVVTHACEVRQ
jgi:hypothetical protein